METILDVKYYSLSEAAKEIGVTLVTIYRWRDSGKFSCVKRGGRYFVEESVLRSLVK